MSKGMPERGDPIRLAELDRHYEGELSLSGLGRLSESLVPSEGRVSYAIRFDRDDRGRGRFRGRLHTELPLRCQRCLDTYRLPVTRVWQLMLIEDPAEEKLLDDGEDACLVRDRGMALADLIEDELILALPVVPVHAERTGCRPPANPAAGSAEAPAGERENPFAELARLKRDN